MSYKIDKDVPIPEDTLKGRRGKYPFATMAIGDSFLVPVEDMPNDKGARAMLRTISGAAYCWGHVRATAKRAAQVRARFSVRIVHAGVRCWRVE